MKRSNDSKEDLRERKISIIAHCLINQNARVYGGAIEQIAIQEVIDLILSRGFGILQLPCPETVYRGLRRRRQT